MESEHFQRWIKYLSLLDLGSRADLKDVFPFFFVALVKQPFLHVFDEIT